jgi:hypothetical protein
MPVILIFVNYLVTLFVGLAVLSGAAPWWIIGILPVAVFLEYRLYRASEPADDVQHARPAHT